MSCHELHADKFATVIVYHKERLLGEDGNPRKTKDGEDPYHMGLVLEWVYGTIVSTAEKARDSAKKPLGELRSPLVFATGTSLQSWL
jgi:hypothetical protein